MQGIFQVFLVLCTILSVLSALRIRGATRWLRLSTVAVGCFLIVIILRPLLATDLAQLVNIGRGADLIFYVGGAFGGFCAIQFHRRLVEHHRLLTSVVRAIAVRDAKRPGDDSDRSRLAS